MPFTFTIASKTFGALASANGAYALSAIVESGIYDIIRYHVKGVDGSYLTRGGLIGYTLKLRMRYISTTPYADLAADQSAWENTAVAIAEPGGHTYTRCTLNPSGLRAIRDATAMGRGIAGQQFLDAEAVFTCDGART
jgi:hypothetical protein